jgi:hypothetical protein
MDYYFYRHKGYLYQDDGGCTNNLICMDSSADACFEKIDAIKRG